MEMFMFTTLKGMTVSDHRNRILGVWVTAGGLCRELGGWLMLH